MGRYRARDLTNGPTLLSLLRVPLAAVFPLTLDRPALGLVVLACAALTDVLDGWIARRFDLATPTGAVVDGLTDKTFVAAVLVSLLATHRMTFGEAALLGTRELGELPLVVWLAASPEARRRKVEDRANVFGKAATVLQFAAVVGVLLGLALRTLCFWGTAVVGAAAATSYWVRTLQTLRRRGPTVS